ncbi:PAS domain-containing protein [Natronosalvus vescus]|uniref:PAS domain-containing protein n=1 Tax=Natronosalvus vescus TaxID=2953881 RepID=UPI002091B0D8|nr:PAS domain-containing protein [Natronosalvus vescus]
MIRVLYFGDESGITNQSRTALEAENTQLAIEVVSNVDEALSRVQDGTVDCVVTDHHFPHIDGLGFLKSVRERHPCLPVILFTANGSEEVASAAISAGVTDYLPQGGDNQYERLANRIKTVVSQHTPQRFQTVENVTQFDLMERFSDPVYALNSEWEFTYANKATSDTFGKHPKDLIGQHIWEVFPEATQTPFYDHYHEALAKNKTCTIEEPFEPWGRWYREHIYPAEDGLIIISFDVTEQKRQAQELDRNREVRRHTETLTDIGGWELDAKTGAQRWTAGTYRIHDLDPEGDFEPTLEAGLRFYLPEDRGRIESVVQRCLETGERYELELRLITADDCNRWVQTNGEPIRDEGEIVGARGAIQDITQRKVWETQLRNLSQFREAIIESANVWINALDEAGHVVLWNEAAEQISGYTAEEVVGTDKIWAWLYPDSEYRQTVTELASDISSGERSVEEFETTITTKDGRERIVSWNSHPISDELGNVSGSVAVGRDITEGKESEWALEERVKELTTIKRVSQAFLISDTPLETLLADFLETLFQSFQYSEITAATITCGEIVVSTENFELREPRLSTQATTADGEQVTLEVVYLENRPQEDIGPFLAEEQELLDMLIPLVSNQINLRQRERKLREQNRYMDRIFDTMDDIFFIVGTDGKIRHYNRAARDVWGYPEGQAREMSITEFVGSRDVARIEQFFESVQNTKKAGIEVDIVTGEGRHNPYEFRANSVDDPDGETAIIGIGRDKSEVVDRTKQLQVMDRVLRHNLRNDMTVIGGYAELICQEATGSVATYAETIVETCQQLMTTVEKEREIIDVLAEPPERSLIDTVAVAQLLVDAVREVNPDVDLTLDLPVEATAFTTDNLHKALRELLVNAIVHNDQPTPAITITITDQDESVQIDVADNGPPIPEEEVKILSRNRGIEPLLHGSGLGLLLVHWIVYRSDGTLYFKTNEPRGNVISISLPKSM